MFSAVTIYNAITLNILSIAYIDNRAFTGVDETLPPGPIGYQYLTYSDPMDVVATLMFLLNNWLADGLLVSSVPSSVVRVCDVVRISRSIVASLFIPRTTGSLLSHV